jgi:hypothetical protein
MCQQCSAEHQLSSVETPRRTSQIKGLGGRKIWKSGK